MSDEDIAKKKHIALVCIEACAYDKAISIKQG